jgi:hypothetical protein
MDVRAMSLVKEAMCFINAGEWKDAETCLQRIYSILPKEPNVLIRYFFIFIHRSILINAYLTAKVIPSDQKSKMLVINMGEDVPPAVVNGASMVKSAIGMADQVHLKSNDLYLDMIRCFLNIGGKYIFSKEASWNSIFPLLIETAIKAKAPNTWLILLLMADCFSNKDNDKVVALKRLDAVFSIVESDQGSAGTFYACLMACIHTDFLEKVYPKWESVMALNLFVKITRIHSNAEAISIESFDFLQKNLKTFIKTNHADKLSKALNFQLLILKLASIALECDLYDRSLELLGFVNIFDRNSEIFIQKEYLLAELALYDLEKTKNTDLFKRSAILVGLAEAVDMANKSNLSVQLINQGCLLIWKTSRPFFPTPKFHKYHELITALKICVNALDSTGSSLHLIRAKIHHNLSLYFYYQDFVLRALDQVNAGLSLSISNDPIQTDLRLLKIMISIKLGDVFDSSQSRGNYKSNPQWLKIFIMPLKRKSWKYQ